jgi:integrase
VSRLLERQVNAVPNEWDVVFCSALGKHTFRKTAATWLDEDGVSGRQAANQLGHAKPSMTMDHYMSRRAVTERAALVL